MSTEKSKHILAKMLEKGEEWGTSESYTPKKTASYEDGAIFLIDKTLSEFKNELKTAEKAGSIAPQDAAFLLKIFKKVENGEISRFDEISKMQKEKDVINRLQYGGFILSLELFGLNSEIEKKFGSKNYIINSKPSDLANKKSELAKMAKSFMDQGFLIKHTFLWNDGSVTRTKSTTIKKLNCRVLDQNFPWFRKNNPEHHLFKP